MSVGFSSAARRQAAADRFARATRLEANPAGASAAPDATDEASLFDYDGFLEARAGSHAATSNSNTNIVAPAAAAAGVALPLPASSSHLALAQKLYAGEFGAPIPPANARAANRRHYYLKHHLQPPAEEDSANQRASAAGLSLPARVAPIGPSSSSSSSSIGASPSVTAPQPLRPDYFDDDEMERRRPALYHEYIGQYEEKERRQQEEREEQEEEEDAIDRATRRGQRGGQRSEEEDHGAEGESQRMSDILPAAGGGGGGGGSDKSREKAARKNKAAHLPESLSALLLANYDNVERKARRERAEAAAKRLEADGNAASQVATSPAIAISHARPSTQPRVREPDAMLDSDESELSDDEPDAAAAAFAAFGRRPPGVLFHADDGITTDPTDGSDLREAGPTASAEAAEFYRQQVDDDMDARQRREEEEAEERRQRRAAAAAEQERSHHVAAASLPSSSVPHSSVSSSSGVAASAADVRSVHTSSLRSDFLRVMHQLFLDGYDDAFVVGGYATIDANDEYEDWRETERSDQEAYFDAHDEEPGQDQETSETSQAIGGERRQQSEAESADGTRMEE